MLQRVYGTAWENAAQLAAHVELQKEAKRRDHRTIGKATTTYYLPLTTCHLPFTTYYSQLTTYCLLLTTYYFILTIGKALDLFST